LTKECPANILANNRIPRLIARARYDTSSIQIIKGAITEGVPVGYIIEKYLILCNEIPNIVTTINIEILIRKVYEASLVVVSIPGIMPKIFDEKIKACRDEDGASISSHSELSVSSSSIKDIPLLPKTQLMFSITSIIS
jgi:hypothetical protein